jgi:dsRNA-specific ribonuclease
VNGEGKSRRKAEQVAAELAIAQVKSRFAEKKED